MKLTVEKKDKIRVEIKQVSGDHKVIRTKSFHVYDANLEQVEAVILKAMKIESKKKPVKS